MSEKGYEFFDHTADIGIRAEGATLAELFTHLTQGLVELIAEDSLLAPRETCAISLSADAEDLLLLAWLNDVLFRFSTTRFLPVQYQWHHVRPTTLRGDMRGERFDPARHTQGREVKAITRHLLSVQQRNGRWCGQVVVDI